MPGLAIGSLVARGEVPLSRVAFLLVGGLATFCLLAVTVLSPRNFYEYFDITADLLHDYLLTTSQQKAIAAGTMTPPLYLPVIVVLLNFVVSTPLLLLPALLAGRVGAGYRLKLQSTRETTEAPCADAPVGLHAAGLTFPGRDTPGGPSRSPAAQHLVAVPRETSP